MEATVWFAREPSAGERRAICERIAAEYGLTGVHIRPEFPQTLRVELPAEKSGGKKSGGKVLMGSPIKGSLTALGELDSTSGTVCVEGKVFATENKDTRKGSVLRFSITDYTGSLQVSQFFPKGADNGFVSRDMWP